MWSVLRLSVSGGKGSEGSAQPCQIHTHTLAREHRRAIHDARTTAGRRRRGEPKEHRSTVKSRSDGRREAALVCRARARRRATERSSQARALHPATEVPGQRRPPARSCDKVGHRPRRTIAAELVAEGKLEADRGGPAQRTKERTR